MINGFDVFAPPSKNHPSFVNQHITGKDWDDVVKRASYLSNTQYFWVTSKPDDIILNDTISTFQPVSPLWTKANAWFFYSNKFHYSNKWSTLRLYKKRTILNGEPLVVQETHTENFVKNDSNLPVFFVSNGETNSEENWVRLKRICPRARRIENVTPRETMFRVAAFEAEQYDKASHFFIVTGKNFVVDESVFNFTPDPWAPEAHWIFHAHNLSNDLQYGHMGIGCYSVEAVRNTPKDYGLDFTMYSPTIEVPVVVSRAEFATTPYEAWRTAFREAIKLTCLWKKGDVNACRRLLTWHSFATGQNRGWVLAGAMSGKMFALKNINDNEILKQSVEWDWLHKQWVTKYSGVNF